MASLLTRRQIPLDLYHSHPDQLMGILSTKDRTSQKPLSIWSVFALWFHLQEDNFTELLAVQHRELTNENLMELEPKERTKRDKRKK